MGNCSSETLGHTVHAKEENEMRRTWWEFGISAAVLLLVSMSINCADLIGADFGRVFIVRSRAPSGIKRMPTPANVNVDGVWGDVA